MNAQNGSLRRYRIERTERAEMDQDDAFLRLNRLLGPRAAGDWLAGLVKAVAGLVEFPSPRSHAIDEAAGDRYGLEVRRMLYFGSRNRRSHTPYRVLFTIIEPAPGEDEGVVRVLRILHGASDPFSPQPGDEESA